MNEIGTNTMGRQELEALDTLLSYVANDEERNFRDEPSRRHGHIYRSIYVLMRYRGWDLSKHVNPDTAAKPRPFVDDDGA
jgi:hypothetical protein